MPILDPRHDLAHPVESDGAWSESYYFNCYDPDADTGFFTRVGVRPNEGTIDVGLSVWAPGGGLAVIRAAREQHEMVDTGLAVGGVAYERRAPMREWRVTADADATPVPGGSAGTTRVVLDVVFSALTPAIGVDGQEGEGQGRGATATTRGSVGKGHLEPA